MESRYRSTARRAASEVARRVRHRLVNARHVRLLVHSPLFDHEWYSHCVGRSLERAEAAEHYLRHGRSEQFTPNPLFDPDYFASQSADLLVEGEDPFVSYVRGKHWWAPVHPLVQIRRYLVDHPEAQDHPTGPIGHYLEHGAALGHRINAWYLRDPRVEPRGLVDWMWRQVSTWHSRQAGARAIWGTTVPHRRGDVPPDDPGSFGGRVSVVLVAEHAPSAHRSIRSLLAQTTRDWELLVCLVEGGPSAADLDLADDERSRVLPAESDEWAARNAAIRAADGDWIAFMTAGDLWLPSRLEWLAQGRADRRWRHDIAEDLDAENPLRYVERPASRTLLESGGDVELGTVVVARDLALANPFDAGQHHAAGFGFMLRLAQGGDPEFVQVLGVQIDSAQRRERTRPSPGRRPWLDHDDVEGHRDAALNQILVDWQALESRTTDPGLISIVMPTYKDYEMTRTAVRLVMEAAQDDLVRVEVVVIDNGCPQLVSMVLASLAMRYPDEVTVLAEPVNRGFALGNNVGLALARGSTVVFLNNDTEVKPGWLTPLVEALADPEVLAAQSLLVYAGGSVQSAGIVFPPGGGVPHALLQGFPREDATGVEGQRLHALTGAALAARFADVVDLRGFDPVFRNGMEDIDFCLRLRELRPGHCVVRPASEVIHHESRSEGRFKHVLINRKVFLDRWRGRLPADDSAAWLACGFRVVGRGIRRRASPDQRICVAEPVVERVARAQVTEHAPRLRWAIKNPAPFGQDGERWGDTHFARQLASALRERGQEVVIDHRPEFMRASSWHDDVVLLLKGLAPYSPMPEHVNLMWLISHPEMTTLSEGVGWDRVYVASVKYAADLARRWPVPVVPLWQATDTAKFHPGLARPDTGFPLLFVGNSRRQERPMVMGALEKGLALSVIGSDWESMVPRRFIRAQFLPNDEVGAAYRAAGIVLNDHWEDMREEGFISNRLFDAVAAGARVISDDVVGLRDVFGEAVLVARTADELAAIVRDPDRDRLFGTDDERRAQAAKIAADHSFDVRAGVLLDDAVSVWRERNR